MYFVEQSMHLCRGSTCYSMDVYSSLIFYAWVDYIWMGLCEVLCIQSVEQCLQMSRPLIGRHSLFKLTLM